MANLKKYFTPIIFIVAAAGIMVFWIYYQAMPNQRIKELQAVEVKEYEGENLSSVIDFRENSIKGPQYIDMSGYKLNISGLVSEPKVYTYDEITNNFQNYKKVVALNCVEGWNVNILWQGILVKDIVKASLPKSEAKTIIFHAVDGYTTSFPIDYIMGKDILLAYKINDVVLPPERGFPFQLVAEDKWGYKWIKWVKEVEFSANENYQGYWESRGYSNSGDLNQGFSR